MTLPYREEWYGGIGNKTKPPPSQPQRILSGRVYRYYGHIQLPEIVIEEEPKNKLNRTCITKLFQPPKLSKYKNNGKKNADQTLEKMKNLYQQQLRKKREHIAELMRKRRQRKRQRTWKEKKAAVKKMAKERIRELNLKWIENHRILQKNKTPLNAVQRLIVEKCKKYYDDEMFKEMTMYFGREMPESKFRF